MELFTLKKAQLKFLLACASKDDFRPHMSAVHVSTTGAFATNGHTLGIVRPLDLKLKDSAAYRPVPRSVLHAALKMMQPGDSIGVSADDDGDGSIGLVVTSGLWKAEFAKLRYNGPPSPPFGCVFPGSLKTATGGVFSVNPDYLAMSRLAWESSEAGNRVGVEVYQCEGTGAMPIVILAEGASRAALVVMPMRNESVDRIEV